MGGKTEGVEVRKNSIRINFTHQGVRYRKTLMVNGEPMRPTQGHIAHAEKMRAEIVNKIRLGFFKMHDYFPEENTQQEPANPNTVGACLDKWKATLSVTHSTNMTYGVGIRFWKASNCDERHTKIGDVALSELKFSHIMTALANAKHLSGKTLNNWVSVLRSALDLAVKDKLLSENPCNGIKNFTHQKKVIDPFSRDEAEAIILDMQQHYPSVISNMIEFSFFSGLRSSETQGLLWSHVDLGSGVITVQEAIVASVRKLKTKTSVARDVHLNSRARGALTRQAEIENKAGTELPVWSDPNTNQPFRNWNTFRLRYWIPTLTRLGIRYRRPYNTRHTYATMMLMAGMTPAFCAKQLGHSIEMFLNTYAKWLNGEQDKEEMARLERAIVPK